MIYRDPVETLRAENVELRTDLAEARRELEEARFQNTRLHELLAGMLAGPVTLYPYDPTHPCPVCGVKNYAYRAVPARKAGWFRAARVAHLRVECSKCTHVWRERSFVAQQALADGAFSTFAKYDAIVNGVSPDPKP